MKTLTTIVRILLGALFLFASISFLFHLAPMPELSGTTKTVMDGFVATGYLLTLAKCIELVCGVAFVTGFFVPLAAILIAPISVNIFMFHLMVEPSGIPTATFVLLANLLLGWAYRERYSPLFKAR